MKHYFGRLSGVALAIALFAQVSVAQSEPRYKELPNFHQVCDGIYRGAQPGSGGIKKLKELGIKTIINLRGEDSRTRKEKEEAEAEGLHYYSIPMDGIGRPTDKQIARVLEIIDAPENQPVFIHCKRGSDRTGTAIACHRIEHDGWTAGRAVTEAKRHGMNWIMFGMRDYIAGYYNRHSQSADKVREGKLSKIGAALASAGYRGWNALRHAGAAVGLAR